MTQKNERQHYLPRMYLKNFSNSNNKVYLFNDQNNLIKEVSTKDSTLIKDFYTITNEAGEKDYLIENYMATIETTCAPIIQKLIRKEAITLDEKFELSLFIGIMQCRTPAAVKLIHETMNPALEFIKNHIFHSGMMNDFIKKSEQEYCLSKEQQLELLGNSTITLTNNGTWAFLMSAAEHISRQYANMRWELYYSKISSFITSDSPLVILPSPIKRPGLGGNAGIALPGVQKFFTIAPNVLLKIGDLGDTQIYYYETDDKVFIRHLNCLIFSTRKQFVIAKDQGHLEFLLKRTKGIKNNTEVKVYN